MKLLDFRIQNYRSIDDSGTIEASRITALLGRNESGKSNLLRALHSLNPPDGFKSLNKIKDFPRHRRLEECTDSTPVVYSRWELSEEDKAELGNKLPQAASIEVVCIGRNYGGPGPWIELDGVEPPSFDAQSVTRLIKAVSAAMRAAAEGLEPKVSTDLTKAADEFEIGSLSNLQNDAWAKSAISYSKKARTAIASANAELTEKQDGHIEKLESLAHEIGSFDVALREAKGWILQQLPIFMFLEEYPELNGHQNISEYLARKNSNSLTEADRNFEKLCKVAGLDPRELDTHLSRNDQATRNQLANRASAVVTTAIRRLWNDRSLHIRFNLDASHFDTFVSDPNSVYEVEVNLDERSRGFKWFLSFYITFAADTDGGAAQNAILLLDEPGLYLHAKSQTDLLTHLESDFANQIIYTTHSPFMVPIRNLDSIRTVNISEESGTAVTNDPTGDSRTLFPLQAALGYELSQSLFVGARSLVVEGVTDFWILSAVSSYLRDNGSTGLHEDLTITPAGGAQKISYMVALLTSQKMNVIVLLDDERDARNTRNDLVRSKLIREENVVFVSEGSTAQLAEADLEDLIDEIVFDGLIRESYAKELEGKDLVLNSRIPRIAKRYDKALADLGIEFFKTRPARLLLKVMGSDPGRIMTPETANRFSALFEVINSRCSTVIEQSPGAFE